MKWVKIKDSLNAREELPKDKQFFALWKGNFCISEFNEEEDLFYMCMYPAQYTSEYPLPRYSEHNFFYFCIPEYPEDY